MRKIKIQLFGQLKKVAYQFLGYIDIVLQILVKPKKLSVCYSSLPDFSDNAYYVFRHLLQTRSNIEHVWLIKDPKSVDIIRRNFTEIAQKSNASNNRLTIKKQRSIFGYLAFLYCYYAFHTHGMYAYQRKSIRRCNVSLWHGMPIKCIGRLNTITPNLTPFTSDWHIATSDFFKYIICSAFDSEPAKVIVSALPRCDALRFEDTNDLEKTGIHQLLDIHAEKKVVLWMPTYRTETKSKEYRKGQFRSFLDDMPEGQLDILNTHATKNQCHILIKLHPSDLLNNQLPGTQYSNISFLPSKEWQELGAQLYNLVAVSDALITDVSSILFDYIPTNRPIGLIGFQDETYTRDLVFPIQYVLGSNRINKLEHESDINSFFTNVGMQKSFPVNHSDIASIFNNDFKKSGCESICNAIGI